MVFGLFSSRRYFFLIFFCVCVNVCWSCCCCCYCCYCCCCCWSVAHCILISVRYNVPLRRSTAIFNHYYCECVIDLGLNTNEFSSSSSSSYLLLLLLLLLMFAASTMLEHEHKFLFRSPTEITSF